MVYRNLVDLQESHNRLKAAGIPLDVAFMNMRMTDGYQDFTIDGNVEVLIFHAILMF